MVHAIPELMPASRDKSVRPDLTVVVPAFNECESLELTVREILAYLSPMDPHLEVIIVDDGSTDGTSEAADRLDRSLAGQVRTIHHGQNLGLGSALCTGFRVARGQWVGALPADGQFRPEDLATMFQTRDGTDAVVGEVSVSGRYRADSLFRLLLSWGMRWAMRLMHPNIPAFNGIILIRNGAMRAEDIVSRTGFAHLEILDRMKRNGNSRRTHVPIVVRPRQHGVSKVTNRRTILRVLGDILRLRLSYMTHRG